MAEDKSVFLNPYNFISFPQKKAEAYTDTDKHTGVIEYTITTKTPLFIPNSSSDRAFKESEKVTDHKSYDFFSYTNLNPGKTYENEYHLPAIPGSEMRGVVRNAYETLTDSCMGLLNEEEHPVKRSAERFKPALLCRKNEKLVLYDADSLRIEKKSEEKESKLEEKGSKSEEKGSKTAGFDQYRNGSEVYFKDTNGDKNKIVEKTSPGKYAQKGYLLKWGMGVKKARYHVLVAKNEIRGISFTREEVESKLMTIVRSYMDQPAVSVDNMGAYKEYADDLQEFLKGNMPYFPVNYSVLDGQTVYLAPATYSKEVYNNTIGKLAGEFAPCKNNFCPACDLFGHIGKNNETSKSSKIRFTDLYVTEEKKPEEYREYYLKNKVTLQTLGGPKLGNVDFYLKKPKNATFWTYDYYVVNGKIQIKDGELRGRKYYWHHPQVHLEEAEATRLNKTVRPLKKDVEFRGKLYFESISEKQLRQLIWILNSGSEELGLKLSAGKPLGLGSISCVVNQVQERKINLTGGSLEYSVEEIPFDGITYEQAEFSEYVKEEFYKIAGLNSVPKDMQITYPRTLEQKDGKMKEGFKWFGKNHWSISKKRTGVIPEDRKDMEILRTLPALTSPNVGLPYDIPNKITSSNNTKTTNSQKPKNQGKGFVKKNNNNKNKNKKKNSSLGGDWKNQLGNINLN